MRRGASGIFFAPSSRVGWGGHHFRRRSPSLAWISHRHIHRRTNIGDTQRRYRFGPKLLSGSPASCDRRRFLRKTLRAHVMLCWSASFSILLGSKKKRTQKIVRRTTRFQHGIGGMSIQALGEPRIIPASRCDWSTLEYLADGFRVLGPSYHLPPPLHSCRKCSPQRGKLSHQPRAQHPTCQFYC